MADLWPITESRLRSRVKAAFGLEAQKSAVEKYLNGGNWELVGEFVEVESGKRKSRPQPNAALALSKKQKATLIIAKLDPPLGSSGKLPRRIIC